MLGTKWIDPTEPAELIHDNRRPPPNLVVRTEKLLSGEFLALGEMHVTAPARTMFDLGRHIATPTVAVQRLDAPVNATDVKPADVEAVMAAHPGARYLPRLRRVLPLVDGGAESPRHRVRRAPTLDRPRGAATRYRKQFALNELGWLIIRVSRDLLRYRRATYTARVDNALHSRGFHL